MNGQSLERVTHEHAVSILKNATSPVELKVSQSAYNYSSFGEFLSCATGFVNISDAHYIQVSKIAFSTLYPVFFVECAYVLLDML